MMPAIGRAKIPISRQLLGPRTQANRSARHYRPDFLQFDEPARQKTNPGARPGLEVVVGVYRFSARAGRLENAVDRGTQRSVELRVALASRETLGQGT